MQEAAQCVQLVSVLPALVMGAAFSDLCQSN